MADRFDCYYKWLGIPPEEQPPDHYRLLGVRRFESDLDVIDNAASRQMAHVRTFQGGPQAALSQKLLNEIARARACLLDGGAKARYDAELARAQGTHSPPGGAKQEAAMAPLAITTRPPPRRGGQRDENKQSGAGTGWQVMKIVGGGVLGLALGYALLYFVVGVDPVGVLPPRVKQVEAPVAVVTPPRERPALPEPTPLEPAKPETTPVAPEPAPKPPKKPQAKRPVGSAKPVVKSQPKKNKAGSFKLPPLAPRSETDLPSPAEPATPATPASPAQPAGPPEVLAGVAEAWRLPELGNLAVTKVAALSREPEETIALTIRSEAAVLPARSAILVETEESGKAWAIFYAPVFNGAAKTKVAHVRREGADLLFGWSPPAVEAEVLRQFPNCQLEIRHGSDLKTVQLRESFAAGELVLNLTDDKQTLEVPVAGLPKLDLLRLRIRELSSFPAKAAIRGGDSTLVLGQQAVIEFADQPGAEIGVRFFHAFSTGKLMLRLEPVFRENKVREYELTLKQLEATRDAMEKVTGRARESLAGAEAELAAAQRAKGSLESSRPNPGDVQGRAIWEPRYQQVNTALSRAATRVERFKEQIAENQARLEAVPRLKSFLDSLHQRAAIRFVICAECPGRDIVLVDGMTGSGLAETP
jgi:hypothetical protein